MAVVLETRGKGAYGTGETTIDKYLVNKLERSKVVRWMAPCLWDAWVFLFPVMLWVVFQESASIWREKSISQLYMPMILTQHMEILSTASVLFCYES